MYLRKCSCLFVYHFLYLDLGPATLGGGGGGGGGGHGPANFLRSKKKKVNKGKQEKFSKQKPLKGCH